MKNPRCEAGIRFFFFVLLVGGYGLDGGFFFDAALEAFKNSPRVFRRALQRVENLISHFHRSIERCLLAAILAVGEILGELVPLAADAQTPPLKGSGLVGVSGYVTLGHIVVAGLVPDAPILPHLGTSDNLIC